MDVQSVVPLQITIPVLAVVVLVCLVFMFGFRMTSPQPPSFDFDDDSSDKKSRRGRRRVTTKYEKAVTNGTVLAPKENREKAAPVTKAPVQSNSSAASNESPKKAKSAPQKIVTGTTGAAPKPKKPENDKVDRDGGEQEDEGWITPVSKKERKQNKQQATNSSSSQGPARLSPRPHRVSATGDNQQSNKAANQTPWEEPSISTVTADKPKQKEDPQEVLKPNPPSNEEIKAISTEESKKIPETMVSSVTQTENMDSPTHSNKTEAQGSPVHTSKSSRKKKKAAAAATAVAEFAETLTSLKTQPEEIGAGDGVEGAEAEQEGGAEPEKSDDVTEKEGNKTEENIEEFTVAKSKKSKKKKGKNSSAIPSPEAPQPPINLPDENAAITLATSNSEPVNEVKEKQGTPKKSSGSPKKSAKKSEVKTVEEAPSIEVSKTEVIAEDPVLVQEKKPSTHEAVEERLSPKTEVNNESMSEPQAGGDAPSQERQEGGAENSEDWVEAKPVKKKKKVRRDV